MKKKNIFFFHNILVTSLLAFFINIIVISLVSFIVLNFHVNVLDAGPLLIPAYKLNGLPCINKVLLTYSLVELICVICVIQVSAPTK